MNGGDIGPFDFEIPQVKPMSADLHKYGYCAKGASTVLFRNEELKKHIVFQVDEWPCGTMITPTLTGTRPGGAIAAAYAVMNYLGIDGYREKQKAVTDTRDKLEKAIMALGFQILGQPKMGLFAYASDELDIAAVWQNMYDRGWCTALNITPPSIHLMLSPYHAEVWHQYVDDLKLARDEVAASGNNNVTIQSRYN